MVKTLVSEMDDEQLEREAAKIIFSASAKAEEEEVIRAEPQGPEIPFTCPFCNDSYQVSEQLAGKKINCRTCREPCRVDAKKVEPPGFHARSFWIGLIVGIVVTLVSGVVLTVLGALLHKITNVQ